MATDTYTEEMGNRICAFLAQGFSLKKTCEQEGIAPIGTVWHWLHAHHDFKEAYYIAKAEAADAMSEDILELSDSATDLAQAVDPKASNAVVQARRLQVDSRKWIMSKMQPKRFGDKIDVTTNGKDLPTPIYNGQSIPKT